MLVVLKLRHSANSCRTKGCQRLYSLKTRASQSTNATRIEGLRAFQPRQRAGLLGWVLRRVLAIAACPFKQGPL